MIDLYTLTMKEVSRFLRVWKQTLVPPVITIVLYLWIFWKFIGDRISVVEAPMAYWKILLGFCAWAMLRAVMVAGLVFTAAAFMTDIKIDNIWLAVVFIFLSALLFSLLGLYNGLYAKSFDDIALIPTFLITPLIYLGWVFYPISILPNFWQIVSQFNPILYMIGWLRYAFIWESEINIFLSFWILVTFITILIVLILYLLKKGYGIRS